MVWLRERSGTLYPLTKSTLDTKTIELIVERIPRRIPFPIDHDTINHLLPHILLPPVLVNDILHRRFLCTLGCEG